MKAAIVTVCMSMAAGAAAADQMQDIKAKGELVCGTLGMTRGMSFIDPQTRQLAGYEVDLCHAIADALGVAPKVVSVGVPARIPELQAGRIDILLAELAYTEERAKQVDYSHPYMVIRTTVMVNDPTVASLADLAGRKVSLTKGSTQESRLREQVPGVEIVSFDTTSQAFLAFQQGKTIGYSTDDMTLLANRAMLGDAGKGMTILDETLMVEREGVGIRKDEPALKDAVNEVLEDLEASGEGEAMFMKWLGPGTAIGFEQRNFRIDGNWQPS